MHRRSVLKYFGGVSPVFLVGCVYAGAPDDCSPDNPPPTGFEIRNRGPDEYELTVEVIHELIIRTETIHNETYRVEPPPGEHSIEVADVARFAGHHIIRVTTEEGSQTDYLWEVTPDRCDPVRIDIQEGEVTISDPDEPTTTRQDAPGV